MEMNSIIACLGTGLLSVEEVRAIQQDTNLTKIDFCNKVSTRAASEYLENKISFCEADTVLNTLFSFMVSDLSQMAEPTFSIYLAFDEGEYHHAGDSRKCDLENRYTKPLLRKIFEELTSIKTAD